MRDREKISEYGATFYLRVEYTDNKRYTAYFGTPAQALIALYGLEQVVPGLSASAKIKAQTTDGRTLTLVKLGTGFYWMDGETEYGADPEIWPMDDDGKRLELFDCRVGINPNREPLFLLVHDNCRYCRCWTPKQAIDAAYVLKRFFANAPVTLMIRTANGAELRYAMEAIGPVAAMTYHGDYLSFSSDADGWPIDVAGERIALQQPKAYDSSFPIMARPDFVPSPVSLPVADPVPAQPPNCVLQSWVCAIPKMQQTVLMTALRGPDSTPKYGPAKYLLRWYRRCILLSAMDGKVLSNPIDPNGGSFTGPSMTEAEVKDAVMRLCDKQASLEADKPGWIPRMDELVGEYMQNLDATPYHYHGHFMHGAQILGVHHPDLDIRHWWWSVYLRLVHALHLHPETPEEMNKRLGDNRADWLARADVALAD